MRSAVPSVDPLSTTRISRRSAGWSLARTESMQSPILSAPLRTGITTLTKGGSASGPCTGLTLPLRLELGGRRTEFPGRLDERFGEAVVDAVVQELGGEEVLDRDAVLLARFGLGKAAAGGLDLADLVGEGPLGPG